MYINIKIQKLAPFKQNGPHAIIFVRSLVLVHKFRGPTEGRTDRRTDRYFSKKFSFFFLIKNIYTRLYLSRLFFKFHPHSDQS